jgi:osomolarity two-component system phosphorelay intermediate protein YPD1
LKNICEKIQHLGSNKDELGITDISQEEALSRIKSSLKAVKEEYERAETYLRELYEEDDMVEPEPEEEVDEPDEDSQKLEKDNQKDESTSDRGQDPKNSQDHDINPIPISTPTEVPPSAS